MFDSFFLEGVIVVNSGAAITLCIVAFALILLGVIIGYSMGVKESSYLIRRSMSSYGGERKNG